MFPEIRVQAASVVVGLLTITVAAEAVWAVSLSVNPGRVKAERVIDETKYLPRATEVPTTTLDELIFAPPPRYAVLTPEIALTDLATPPASAAAVSPVAVGPAVPRPTTDRG